MKQNMFDVQASGLFEFWNDLGAPTLRTVCEVGVGPQSLLVHFRDFSRKTILVEPNPKLAQAARDRYSWADVHEVAIFEKNASVDLRVIDGKHLYLKGCSHLSEVAWPYSYRHRHSNTKVAVEGVTFDLIDDGEIDLLNLDCEGSEWYVLSNLVSRPLLIQIENQDRCQFRDRVENWFLENGYTMEEELSHCTYRYRKSEPMKNSSDSEISAALVEVLSACGSPSLRTVVECGGGERSSLGMIAEKSQRVVIAEAHPRLARGLRRLYPRAEVRDCLVWDTHRRKAKLRILNKLSYATGIGWTPAFESRGEKVHQAEKIVIETCPMSDIDDGHIDLLLTDTNGCEWGSLLTLSSRPLIIGIRLNPHNAYRSQILGWLASESYVAARCCDDDFWIYQKTESARLI